MMHNDQVKQQLDSLLVAAASGRFRELIMTKPKPSLSFRLMMTSLGCALADARSEGAAALGAWVVAVLLPYVKSLRGELCCVETEPGLRPFSGQDSTVGREQNRQILLFHPSVHHLEGFVHYKDSYFTSKDAQEFKN